MNKPLNPDILIGQTDSELLDIKFGIEPTADIDLNFESKKLPLSEKKARQKVKQIAESKLPDVEPTVATRDTNPVTQAGLLAPQAVTDRVL